MRCYEYLQRICTFRGFMPEISCPSLIIIGMENEPIKKNRAHFLAYATKLAYFCRRICDVIKAETTQNFNISSYVYPRKRELD